MKAAVISTNKNQFTEVKDNLPVPQYNENEILIKAKAFAANPTDWKHVDFKMGKPGDIAGCDVAGVVEKLGSNVKGFKEGDFVSAMVVGNSTPENGAFAEYVALDPLYTIKYNHELTQHQTDPKASTITTFEGAASVSLGLTTVGIVYAHYFNLAKNAVKGDSILIWGGATATGVLAIQVAKLFYGLNVITTASSKNAEFLKSLGADHVFDYNSSNVVEEIKKVGGNRIKFALDTVADAEKTFQPTYDATEGTPEVWIDSLLGLDETSIKVDPSRTTHFGRPIAYNVTMKEKNFGGAIFKQPEGLVEDYSQWWFKELPKYIDQIKHTNLKILKDGLNSVNEAYTLLKENKVSGEKVVWTV